MEENKVEFVNDSKINIIENTESIRGKSSQEIYYSDAFKRYRTLKSQIKLIENQVGKLHWYQKIKFIFWIKYYDVVDYFTNPYRILNRYINKRDKRRDCGFYEDKANDWD